MAETSDRALEAAARAIMGRWIPYGGAMVRAELVDIMRRHGLRGPEPEGSLRSVNEFKRAYLPTQEAKDE